MCLCARGRGNGARVCAVSTAPVCMCPQHAGHPTVQAAPCRAHAVTSQYTVQSLHHPKRCLAWSSLCVCSLCSLLLTMATVGFARAQAGPLPLTLIDRGVEGLWVVPAPCESLPSSVQATASGAMPVAANAGSSRRVGPVGTPPPTVRTPCWTHSRPPSGP